MSLNQEQVLSSNQALIESSQVCLNLNDIETAFVMPESSVFIYLLQPAQMRGKT